MTLPLSCGSSASEINFWDDVNSGVLWNIPTMKSWKTSSSDRVISARGSWTLGWFGLLLPSGEDSMPDVSIVIDIDRRLISIFDINRWKSIKKKVLTSINNDDFPIEIYNDFLSVPIDCYRFWENAKFSTMWKWHFCSLKTLLFL